MSAPVDMRLLPKAVSDIRGEAVLSMMTQIAASFEWRRDLALTAQDIPASYLPYAARSCAVQNYIAPDMLEDMQRRIIENALLIKVREGTIKGVKFVFSLLGMQADWTQWHKMQPMGAPGTHRVVVSINQYIFAGHKLLSEEVQRHARRVLNTVKRHSQDAALEFDLNFPATFGVGGAGAVRKARRFVSGCVYPQTQQSLALGAVGAYRRAIRFICAMDYAPPQQPVSIGGVAAPRRAIRFICDVKEAL